MKKRLLIFLSFIPLISFAQKLINCNDSTSYLINQDDDFYCYIKLTGKTIISDTNRVFLFNDHPLQTLLISSKDYLTFGKEDFSILSTYVYSETEYYTGVYKEKLMLMVIPIDISKDKKAVAWYFDIPEKFQKEIEAPAIPVVRQLSVSIVIGCYVYSIGTSQFKNQSYDELQVMLVDLVKTINYAKVTFNPTDFCKINARNDFLYIGNEKQKRKDFQGAIADYTKAIKSDSSFSNTYVIRGNAKIGLSDMIGAIDDYSKAINLDSKNAEAYFRRGLAKVFSDQKESGCMDFKKSAELGSDQAKDALNKMCK